eukprot:527002-Heterocapsa_arctica.AAC.1
MPAPTPTTKGQGEGKGTGKQFNGICNRCGQWGHRAATCKVVMALEASAQSVNCMGEIMSVEKVNGDAGVLLMVDSGACMSTCPRSWCDWAKVKMDDKIRRAVTATGSPLVIYGVRT